MWRILSFICYCYIAAAEEPESAIVTNTECGERLAIDYAQISFSTDVAGVTLNALNSQCFRCADSLLSPDDADGCSIIWTPHVWRLKVIDPTGSQLETMDFTFGEHGTYDVSYKLGHVSVEEIGAPTDSLRPIWILSAVLIFVIGLSFGAPVAAAYLAKKYPVFRSVSDVIAGVVVEEKKLDGVSATTPLLDKVDEEAADDEGERHVSGSNISSRSSTRSGASKANSIVEQSLDSVKDSSNIGYADNSKEYISKPAATTPILLNNKTAHPKPGRLSSLDTFRGISLGVMMFVNYGGGGYWFFEHADWNGLTFADVLFPWFMWMMGVSMALSYASMQHHGVSVQELWRKAIKRSIIFSLIGLFMANGYHYNGWRVPGVMQYFAFSYLITSCTVLSMWQTTQERISCIVEGEKHANERSSNWTIHPEDRPWFTRCFSGLPIPNCSVLVAYCYEWIPQALLVILYLAITYGGKAEGCPQGYVGPGGLAEDGQYPGCTGGVHRTIDLLLFGKHHIYLKPTCTRVYGCVGYDPEGCVGSLTACTLTYLGLMSGRVIIHFNSHKERLTLWAIGAAVLLFLAGCLCGFSQDYGAVPVNKNLWSTSFGLVTAGSGLVGLGVTYVLVDVKKWWSGAPFRYVGMNSIFFYCFHGFFHRYFPFSYSTNSTSHGKLLQMHFIGVFCWFVVAFYFYRIKFFVKV